jgi:sulfur relay (sulfurtransferase) DsrC/TusE family protein
MPTIEFEGKQYEVDEEGYLQDWQEWNEGVAGDSSEITLKNIR